MSMGIAAATLAQALVDLASERGQIDEVAEELEMVQSLFDRHLPLKDSLRSSKVPQEAKERIIASALGGRVSPVTVSFLGTLLRVSSVSKLHQVRRAYARLAADARKVVTADLVTAVDIDLKLQDKIRSRVEEISGRSVKLRHRVDPSILGGLVIHIEDEVLDGSVTRQLGTLRASMGGARN